MNPKKLGWLIVIVSVLVIVLLISFKLQLDKQNLKACASLCSTDGESSCSMAQCPYHQGTDFSWILILTSILSAFLGGAGFYITFAKTENLVQEKTYDLTKLSHQERDIFLLIKEHKEGIYQSELVKQLNLSKVKVTRILDKLQAHELIERKRRGMTNIVVVK